MAKAKGVEVADVAQGGEIVFLNLKGISMQEYKSNLIHNFHTTC